MADPSIGVAQGLLNHVHLQSSYSYPYAPTPLLLDQALEHLLRAPRIIRELTAVSWTYLNQPQDGTMMLMWQPVSHMGAQFATDGYVWAGVENVFTQDISGYTVEITVHESGFVPGQEQVAAHRRMRYKLVANLNNAPVDPTLEIVHYTQALPEHRIPSRMLQLSPQQHAQVKERRWLEGQGPLARKEFMLNDRSNWPTVTMPGSQLPGNPYQPAYGRGGMPQFSRTPSATQPYAGQGPGIRHGSISASPVKRGQAPLAHLAGAGHAVMSTPFGSQAIDDLEGERNPEFGDMLDFLTPREISSTRYRQHHEWMEEVLSSPYGTSQILPVDLGLRLTGALGELTEGLWEKDLIKTDKEDHARGASRKISTEQMVEFERRVSLFLQKGEEELNAMTQAHTNRVDELKQEQLFSKLERRLADLPLDGGGEELERLVKEVEKATGMSIVAREEVVRIQNGGLLKVGEENVAPSTDEFADFTNLDTAGEALAFYDNLEYPT